MKTVDSIEAVNLVYASISQSLRTFYLMSDMGLLVIRTIIWSN